MAEPLSLIDFALSLGVILDPGKLVRERWVRFATQEHPYKKNGAIKLINEHFALVKIMTEPDVCHVWHGRRQKMNRDEYIAYIKRQEEAKRRVTRERNIAHHLAANRAMKLLGWSELEHHPYLARKGFPQIRMPVWDKKILVPMYFRGNLCGLQSIDESGRKVFLRGQATKGAYYVLDKKEDGIPLVGEGLATMLSVRQALGKDAPYRYVVAFSANNLLNVARQCPDAVLICDHDAAGISSIGNTSLPHFFPPEGLDFNDWYQSNPQEAGAALEFFLNQNAPKGAL